MKAHTIQVNRTAHYYTLGEPTENIEYFWICCHGYGQLAKNFIHKFDQLDTSKHFILAPDALSRFYWNGYTGQVASSWMTKADRLDEIADYSNYLSQLYQQYRSKLRKNVKIILFGFSQGVATVFRWPMKHFVDFDHLILWAGFVPEDLDYSPYLDYWNQKKLHFLYGTEDEFLTEKRLNWHINMVAEKGLKFDTTVFEGKHVVDRVILKKWVEKNCLI